MLITLKQLKQQIKVLLNNRVWPFKVISDLKSDIDQAKYDHETVVNDLTNFMQREINNADVIFHPVNRHNRQQIVIHTGIQTTELANSYNGTQDTEVVYLDPYVYRFSTIPFPNYTTRPEIAEHYRSMLAEHVSNVVYEHIMKQGYTHDE